MDFTTINKTWTLFLDRDGVINKKLEGDYVKKIAEFEFEYLALEAIEQLTSLFGRTLVVTNQQGIGKGIMTHDMLKEVHNYMQSEVINKGGKIDSIYYSPTLAEDNSIYRKPNTGMAEEARRDYPEIDFKKSIMVGDSLSDMQMGKRVGMFTVYINENENLQLKEADLVCKSLWDFSQIITKAKGL